MKVQLKAAQRLVQAETQDDEMEVSFKVHGDACHSVPRLLAILAYLGSVGSSRTITVDDVPSGTIGEVKIPEGEMRFGFDGDGNAKLTDIMVDGKPFVYED